MANILHASLTGADLHDAKAHKASHQSGGSDQLDVAASLISGTIATARLGSGSATSSTFLRGDQAWATPASSGGSGSYPYLITGRYYDTQFFLPCTITNSAVVAGRLYATPIIFPHSNGIDQIGIGVQTQSGAGTAVRLGIYDDDGTDGLPGTLLYDEGTVVTDTTGSRTITISRTLAAGLYWLAAVFESTPTCTCYTTATINNLGGTSIQTGAVANTCYATLAYGVLTTPFPSSGFTYNNGGPKIAVRAS